MKIYHKRISVKVVMEKDFPGKRTHTIKIRAQAGTMFTDAEIDRQLGSIANKLEKAYPGLDFDLVPLGPATFNIICRGARKAES